MLNKKVSFAQKNRATLLPSKMAIVVNDLLAILCFSFSLMFAIALGSYSSVDKAWSRNINVNIVYNKLGIVGSYFADISYYVFGITSWWFVIGIFYFAYHKISRTKVDSSNWYNLFKTISFAILILCSSLFEYMNFEHYDSVLPNGFGGAIGAYLYNSLVYIIGDLGVAIVGLILLILSFSFTFSVSLVDVAEAIGHFLEVVYLRIRALFAKKDQVHHIDDNQTYLANSKKQTDNFADEISPITYDGKLFDDVPISELAEESEDTMNLSLDPVIDISKPKKINKNSKIKTVLLESDLLENDKLSLLPNTELLNEPKIQNDKISSETLEFVSTSIESKLAEFGVDASIINAESGPVITRYELLPAKGVRGEKIVNLGKEIARGLALTNVRIVETIPGKNSMGLEVPNFKRHTIYLKDIFDSDVYKNAISKLTLALGKDISGSVIVTDLAKMPHLLVAGTTGSGKSVAVNAMILSILFKATPDEVKFIMIDPKMVELSFYHDIPHLLAPVVTDMNQAANALKWAVGEMEQRYRVMAKVGAKNIIGFNQKITDATNNGKQVDNPFTITPDEPDALQKWPYIVVIIDELADLMMVAGKKIEQYIARIAQKARAVGIHLIVATQRPSVDVITGLIKANIPARIAFQVSSKIDSRTILDQMGAETLLGMGDMLFLQPGTGIPQRIHGAFVIDDELNRVVDFLKSTGSPNYVEGVLSGDTDPEFDFDGESVSNNNDPEKDEMFDESVQFILDSKRCSISALQTRFGIGYNRAARIMNQMEKNGLVRRTERGSYELMQSV